MVTPEAFNVTTSPDDTTWSIDRYCDGGLQPWGMLEQGPTGEWWVTTAGATGATTGPYLDEVQAMRALQAWEGPDGHRCRARRNVEPKVLLRFVVSPRPRTGSGVKGVEPKNPGPHAGHRSS